MKNNKKNFFDYKYYLSRTKIFYEKPYVKPTTNLILTIGLSLFFIIFAIKSTLVTIVSLNKEIKDKRQANQILSQKIDSLKTAQITYANMLRDLPLVEAAMPEELDFISLAQRINFLAFSHNLTLNSASFPEFSLALPEETSVTTPEGYQSFAFRISVKGSYTECKSFLKDLENIDRVLEVASVIFNPLSVGQSSEIQMDVNLFAFWLPKPKLASQAKL